MIKFDKSRQYYEVIKMKQYDTLKPIIASFYDSGIHLDLTGFIITLECIKSDGNIVIQDKDILIKNVNEIEVKLDPQITVVGGDTKCQFVLEKNGLKDTTFTFYINIEKSVLEGGINSNSIITILDDLINNIDDAKKVNQQTEDLLSGDNVITMKNQLNIISNIIKPSVYNKSVGLVNWKRELNTLTTTNKIINLNILGTSIACGGIASDYRLKGWVGLLRSYLNAKFTDVGQGFIPSYQKTTLDVNMWTFTGTGWYTSTGYGVMDNSKTTVTLNDKASLQFNGTGITLVTFEGAYSGNIQMIVDGVVKGTFNLYNASSSNPVKEVAITGLTSGNHTLEVKNVETGKALIIIGAYETKGTKGVRVNQNCMFGGTSSMAVMNDSSMKAEIDCWNPILTMIEFQTNDYFNQVPIATFKNNIQTLITRAKLFGDVLLIPCGVREELDTKTIKQTEYIQALKELALSNNVVFMDIFSRWGGEFNYAKNEVNYIFDTVHPNDEGHQDIANWIIANIF